MPFAGASGPVPVTDSLVEGLKRDIRIYVEKCSMIVISSKKSAEESKARARARDEQLIDLEWQMNLLSQEVSTLKEENGVLSADCHRLLGKLQANDYQSDNHELELQEARQHADRLQKEVLSLNEKLK